MLALFLGLGLLFAPTNIQDLQDDPSEPVDHFEAPEQWKPLGKSLWFDPEGKRLILRARVVLREGFLEHLLCLRYTKEHEAILSTDAVPRLIHAGLLLTGAEVGHPVKYQPKFEPPTGTPIAITLEWEEDGQTKSADARTWVLDEEAKTTLDKHWVFAGSMTFQDEQTKETIYSADGGDLITVANFSSAILDVPFASSADDADHIYVANTAQLPPLGTFVTMYLEPANIEQPADDSKK